MANHVRLTRLSLAMPLCLALTVMAGGCSSLLSVEADEAISAQSREIRFVARETEGDRAVWHTDALLIEQAAMLEELVFVLENPTPVEHAFVMPDAKLITRERVVTPESSADVFSPIRIPYVEPLIVTVKPGETKRLRVSSAELSRAPGKRLRFFCSIHKDVHQSGSLYLL